MATHLDLEEQEQLDQLKAFWSQYGNAITWLLIAALGAFAAYNGWKWWQRDQATSAAAIYDELDRAAEAGDVALSARIFEDLRSRHPRTAFAHQGGLLVAKVQFDKGQAAAAQGALAWVRDHAGDPAYRIVARLRLAGTLMDEKKFDQALAQLSEADAGEFTSLVADRRGDVLSAMGKRDEARQAYTQARTRMDTQVDYRRLIDAKLTALGAPPESPL